MQHNPNRAQPERARGLVRDALIRGEMNVPSVCQRCDAPNRRCSDGRRYLQAHHPDHSKPLDVEWLCARCHRAVTPLACGERHGNAKLTAAKVAEAKRRRADGESCAAIARSLGVSRPAISHVVNGRYWISEREKNHG